MQKPIHIVVTTTDYRRLLQFCIKHKIKVPDDSFRHISNWVYVMAVYRNRGNNRLVYCFELRHVETRTTTINGQWAHLTLNLFYLETFNNLQTNNMTYYNIAVLHWEKELVKPKIILAKSEESAQAKTIKLIPDNIDFDDCEVLVSRVF